MTNYPMYQGQHTAPYGYQPMQFGQYQQPTQQTGPELVTVQTMGQVEQIGVQPGQRKIVMVQNEPVIAARFADQMGLVTTEYYQLNKFDPAAAAAQPTQEYVTRAEFEQFVASIKAPARTKKEAATE